MSSNERWSYFHRTHVILRSVALDGIKGQRIDFLFAHYSLSTLVPRLTAFRNRYVDEVQDNLLIDAKSKKIPVIICIDRP